MRAGTSVVTKVAAVVSPYLTASCWDAGGSSPPAWCEAAWSATRPHPQRPRREWALATSPQQSAAPSTTDRYRELPLQPEALGAQPALTACAPRPPRHSRPPQSTWPAATALLVAGTPIQLRRQGCPHLHRVAPVAGSAYSNARGSGNSRSTARTPWSAGGAYECLADKQESVQPPTP